MAVLDDSEAAELDRLAVALEGLRAQIGKAEVRYAPEIGRVPPARRASAANLVQYVVLRPAGAWRAYERRIRELEAAGFTRHGPEDVRYGIGSTQRLVRDGTVV